MDNFVGKGNVLWFVVNPVTLPADGIVVLGRRISAGAMMTMFGAYKRRAGAKDIATLP